MCMGRLALPLPSPELLYAVSLLAPVCVCALLWLQAEARQYREQYASMQARMREMAGPHRMPRRR